MKYLKKKPSKTINPFIKLNIPNNLLPFPDHIRNKLFEVRDLYLALSDLTEEQLFKLKTYLLFRGNVENYYRDQRYNKKHFIVYKKRKKNFNKFLFNSQLSTKVLFSYRPYYLMFNKLANLLMKQGKKTIAIKILFKFFELLKQKNLVSNPLASLMYFLFQNIVPVVKGKVIGFKKKKTLGIRLSISKRISITLKTFIKGLLTHKMPAHYALIVEYFNLLRGKSFLHAFNTKMIKDIEDLKLFKAIRNKSLNFKDPVIFKKYILPESRGFSQGPNPAFSLDNILNIDWKNLDKIIYDLRLINLYEVVDFQKQVLSQLKRYVILKYFLIGRPNTGISKELKGKYNLYKKHKVFTYKFFGKNYIKKNKKAQNFKFFFGKGKERHKIKSFRPLTFTEKLENITKRAKIIFSCLIEDQYRKMTSDKKYLKVSFFGHSKSYIVADKANKFAYISNNPDYSKLQIDHQDINKYVLKNLNNYQFFLGFVYELFKRIDLTLFNNLTEEDFLLFFMGNNPKLINLNLQPHYFADIPKIQEKFRFSKIWSLTDNIKNQSTLLNETLSKLNINTLNLSPSGSNAFNNPILKNMSNKEVVDLVSKTTEKKQKKYA